MKSRSRLRVGCFAFCSFTFGLAVAPTAQPATEASTPPQELASFHFADPNLVIELVACEPDVISPVAISWDEDGRMFVAEMNDYPLESVGGRVRLLEDPDDEGRYKRASVFADQLPFPTSVLPWKGGVFVTAAPNLWYFKDTHQGGRAPERHVVLTGFGEGNQQLRVNGLHWGLDNWIYGANGRSDGDLRKPDDPPARAQSLRGHDFRFHPETGEFQVLAGRSQFGTTRDDLGNRFLSWNTIPIRQVVIEERYLNRNPDFASGESLQDLLPAEDTKQVFPLTPPPLVFNEESSSHFNALAGLTIYRGPALGLDASGQAYEGNAFMGESLRNLVHRRVLLPDGPSFVAKRGESNREFLASTDPWFHPVNFATGPDGALYIVDFYRRFVEHPHYVHDPSVVSKVPWREGAGHGRIWRVRRNSAGAAAVVRPHLSRAAGGDLVTNLENANGWWRDTAQRLLVERGDLSTVPGLQRIARSSHSPLAGIHALWTLQGLASLDDQTLLAALASDQAGVRENAVQLGQDRLNSNAPVRQAVSKLSLDSDPRVRLQTALALGELGGSDDRLRARQAGLQQLAKLDTLNRWQARAILSSVGPRAWPLYRELLADGPRWLNVPTPVSADFVMQLARLIGADRNPTDWNECPAWLGRGKSSEASAGRLVFLAGLADGLAQRGLSLRDWIAQVDSLRQPPDATLQTLNEAALALVRSPLNDTPARLASIRILAETDAAFAGEVLLQLLVAPEPPPVQTAAAQALSRFADAAFSGQVYNNWSQYPRFARQALVAASLRSAPLAGALLDAVEARRLSPMEVDASSRQALLHFSTVSIREHAERLFQPQDAMDRAAVIHRFEGALQLDGRKQHGAEIFAKTCLVCHTVKGVGGQVGPDLSAVGTRPQEALLVDILDPSRMVSPDFLSYTVLTIDGQSSSGLILSETLSNLVLRRPQQPDEIIPRARIKELRADGKSLMPDGLELGLTTQDLADLISFLRNPEVSLLPNR